MVVVLAEVDPEHAGPAAQRRAIHRGGPSTPPTYPPAATVRWRSSTGRIEALHDARLLGIQRLGTGSRRYGRGSASVQGRVGLPHFASSSSGRTRCTPRSAAGARRRGTPRTDRARRSAGATYRGLGALEHAGVIVHGRRPCPCRSRVDLCDDRRLAVLDAERQLVVHAARMLLQLVDQRDRHALAIERLALRTDRAEEGTGLRPRKVVVADLELLRQRWRTSGHRVQSRYWTLDCSFVTAEQ